MSGILIFEWHCTSRKIYYLFIPNSENHILILSIFLNQILDHESVIGRKTSTIQVINQFHKKTSGHTNLGAGYSTIRNLSIHWKQFTLYCLIICWCKFINKTFFLSSQLFVFGNSWEVDDWIRSLNLFINRGVLVFAKRILARTRISRTIYTWVDCKYILSRLT
jgi:hypothetical protein